MKKKKENRLIKKLNSRSGYSLAEALICVLLLLLVSGAMINGIQFAVAQFKSSMELSQATVLCSTLESKLTTKLSDISISTIHHEDTDVPEYPAINMVSISEEGNTTMLGEDGYGYVMLGKGEGASFDGTLLLPAASYTYGMKARAKIIDWPTGGTDNHFKVYISIMDSDEEEELTSTVFDVELHE